MYIAKLVLNNMKKILFVIKKLLAIDSLDPCDFGNSTCIVYTTNYILKNHFNGVRKLGLIPMDPLKIDKMDIVQGGQSPVNIVLNFKNINLLGFSNCYLKGVTGFTKDFHKKKMEMKAFIPLINLIGDYKIAGRMLILPIQGNGKTNITLVNTNAILRFIPKSVIKDGNEYFQIDRIKLRLLTSR